VRIIQPSNEVYSQASHEAHDEDLNHVIELYDFPSTFKTEDLFTGNYLGMLIDEIHF
jgi:hypothetical protein